MTDDEKNALATFGHARHLAFRNGTNISLDMPLRGIPDLDVLPNIEPDWSGNEIHGTVHGTAGVQGPPVVPFNPIRRGMTFDEAVSAGVSADTTAFAFALAPVTAAPAVQTEADTTAFEFALAPVTAVAAVQTEAATTAFAFTLAPVTPVVTPSVVTTPFAFTLAPVTAVGADAEVAGAGE